MTRKSPQKLPFTVRMALASWLAPHRQTIENPTPSTYRSYTDLAADATKALTYPITERHINSLIKSLGWVVPTNVRRSLSASHLNHPVPTGHPTTKYATLCSTVRSLEARLAALEAALGVTRPTE